LVQVMDIQFSEYLFYFGIEIPGIEFIEFHNGIADQVSIFGIACRFVLFDGIDDRMIMMEDIIKNGFVFYKLGILNPPTET
jgi:hypothetical protein